MNLGWVDFTKEDRVDILAFINSLGRKTLDPLDLSIVKDCFFNLMFPKITTYLSISGYDPAKPFLLIPYLLKEAEAQMIRTGKAYDEGVFRGIFNDLRANKGLSEDNVNKYWNTIVAFGILKGEDFKKTSDYIRKVCELDHSLSRAEADFGQCGNVLLSDNFWNPGINALYQKDCFRENISCAQEEAEFLRKQIIASVGSDCVFGYVLEEKPVYQFNKDKIADFAKFAKAIENAQGNSENFKKVKNDLWHARNFFHLWAILIIMCNHIVANAESVQTVYDDAIRKYAIDDSWTPAKMFEYERLKLDKRDTSLQGFLEEAFRHIREENACEALCRCINQRIAPNAKPGQQRVNQTNDRFGYANDIIYSILNALPENRREEAEYNA